ncbi:MAG: hypothetical protein M5U34_20160 [Chloroflexi bacterium]|nr:hypothetical protein [Chloroflexota bacterium]
MLKRGLPLIIAVFFGVLTLVSLLFKLPEVSGLILSWAGFLAGIALFLGVFNLLSVHTHRFARHRPFSSRNLYSGVLALSWLVVFGLGVADLFAVTDNALAQAFQWVQAPLEAALASLLAFFLLFSGIRMLQRERTVWSVLFLATAVTILFTNAIVISPFIPAGVSQLVLQFRELVHNLIVTAGIRGILIGVALGIITLAVRVLSGVERPYNK